MVILLLALSGGSGASSVNDLSDGVTNSGGRTIGLGTGAHTVMMVQLMIILALGYCALGKYIWKW